MKVKITVGRTPTHTLKNVRCNGQIYNVPFPNSTYNFLEIIEDLQISKTHEQTLSIISKKTAQINSIQQFYTLQEDCTHYFNVRIELNSQSFAFTILSEPDLALQELDKLKFSDLLSVLKNSYDSLSVKLHAKLNRRIKKYLSGSKRSQAQKNQILQLIDLIKEDSSQEEVLQKPQQPQIKQNQKYKKNNDQVGKDEEIKKSKKYVSKNQQDKGVYSVKKQTQVQQNEQKVQQKIATNQPQARHQKKYPVKKHQTHHPSHHHSKPQQDDNDNDWQDVKEEKIHKRQQKNWKNKHAKNDIDSESKQIKDFGDQIDEEQYPKQIQKENKFKPKERGQQQNKKLFANFKDRPQRDMRILLGINGDTDDGWRQRYRVQRIPQNALPLSYSKNEKREQFKYKEKSKQKANEYSKPAKTQVIILKPNQKQQPINIQKAEAAPQSEPEQVIIKIKENEKSLTRMFSYPADGKQFILKPNSFYKLHVNNNFWVNLEPQKIIIQNKRGAGFIRQCTYKSSNDYLLQAQDITISLKGNSNLEDGGTKFGDPVMKEFTEGDSQWFNVKTLDIFGYV